MGDVIERRCDEVDRDDVGVAELRPDQRQPIGDQMTGALEQREEVVRAVDLVHPAGA